MDIQENKEKNFIYIEREELFAAYDLYQNRISLKLAEIMVYKGEKTRDCLLYTSPSPRDT